MNNHRRVSVVLLVCLVTTLLALSAVPAEARKGRGLHQGSRGHAVTLLETRLANLSLLTRSAVDRRYRAATVNAVRAFQFQMGLPRTGRVNRYLSARIAREPARRAGVKAPSVIGHRGAVGRSLAEDTLQSLQYAVPYADVLEFDLRLTSDRQYVLMHDYSLDRTTNCSGAVSSWSLEALRAQCTVSGQPIPTFDEAATFAAQVGKTIAPELKDGWASTTDVQSVASTISSHGLTGRTWAQSYYGSLLQTMRAQLPGVRTVLVSGGAPAPSIVKSVQADAVAAKLSSLTIPRVHAYHVAGISVWGYTARSTGEIQTARALVCDAVVTDTPRTARSIYR